MPDCSCILGYGGGTGNLTSIIAELEVVVMSKCRASQDCVTEDIWGHQQGTGFNIRDFSGEEFRQRPSI